MSREGIQTPRPPANPKPMGEAGRSVGGNEGMPRKSRLRLALALLSASMMLAYPNDTATERDEKAVAEVHRTAQRKLDAKAELELWRRTSAAERAALEEKKKGLRGIVRRMLGVQKRQEQAAEKRIKESKPHIEKDPLDSLKNDFCTDVKNALCVQSLSETFEDIGEALRSGTFALDAPILQRGAPASFVCSFTDEILSRPDTKRQVIDLLSFAQQYKGEHIATVLNTTLAAAYEKKHGSKPTDEQLRAYLSTNIDSAAALLKDCSAAAVSAIGGAEFFKGSVSNGQRNAELGLGALAQLVSRKIKDPASAVDALKAARVFSQLLLNAVEISKKK